MFLTILALFNMILLTGLYIRYGPRDMPDEFGIGTAQILKLVLEGTPMCLVVAICAWTVEHLRPVKLADPHRGFVSQAVHYAFHSLTLAILASFALMMAIVTYILFPRLFGQPWPEKLRPSVWQHVVYLICVIWPGAIDMTIRAAKRHACKSEGGH
jgi:hypothetical protein